MQFSHNGCQLSVLQIIQETSFICTMPNNHKKYMGYTGHGVRVLLRGKLAYQALQTE